MCRLAATAVSEPQLKLQPENCAAAEKEHLLNLPPAAQVLFPLAALGF